MTARMQSSAKHIQATAKMVSHMTSGSSQALNLLILKLNPLWAAVLLEEI